MSLLRAAASLLVGLAAILAALLIGCLCGLAAFFLVGWVLLIVVGGGQAAALAILLTFVGFGAFFGLAFAAAVWRGGDQLHHQGPF